MRYTPSTNQPIPKTVISKRLVQKRRPAVFDPDDFFDNLCAQVGAFVADMCVNSELLPPPPSGLSLEAHRERCREQIKELVEAKVPRRHIQSAMDDLHNAAPSMLDQADNSTLQQSLQRAANNMIRSEEFSQKFQEVCKEGHSLNEALQLSEGALQSIYKVGYAYFEQGAFQHARDLFFLLTLLRQEAPDLWRALALAENAMGNTKDALMAISRAVQLNPEEVLYRLVAAELYVRDHDLESARVELAEAARAAEAKGESQRWADPIRILQQRIGG